MRNNARSPVPKGETADSQTVGQIVQFRVDTTVTEPDLPIPATLRPAPIQPLGPTAPTRKLMLFEGEDHFGRLQPMLGIVDPSNANDGTLLWDQPITEKMQFGATEVWEIYNGTADAHPIHLHLVQFQVLGRQKFRGEFSEKELPQGSTGATLSDIRLLGQQKFPELNERGWKDTVIMYPGEVTRIIAKFDRPGEYVWHCHILSHEDHEMMRPFVVSAQPDVPGPAAAGEWQMSAVQSRAPAGVFADRLIFSAREREDESLEQIITGT
jgi:spore coat protein A